MSPIKGHSILIIGGSSGIGAAVAKLAAGQGAHISIASSNPDRVANAVQELQRVVPAAQVKGYTCDLAHKDVEHQLESLLTKVTAATGGRLNHIIYTAGVFNPLPLNAVTIDSLTSSGQVGYFGPLLLAKLAPRFVNKSYRSSLIFTSGRIAEKPIPNTTVAAGWGSALSGMTRGLALDLAPIRINVVSPGITDTSMYGPDAQRGPMMQMFAKSALLGKVGEVEEVAEAYIYLMRDTNNTGSTVNTSGGILLQ